MPRYVSPPFHHYHYLLLLSIPSAHVVSKKVDKLLTPLLILSVSFSHLPSTSSLSLLSLGNQISTVYFSDQILILFGSCMLAAAVEEYSLHRRLALTILRRTGNSPYRLVLGKSVRQWVSTYYPKQSTPERGKRRESPPRFPLPVLLSPSSSLTDCLLPLPPPIHTYIHIYIQVFFL